MQKGIFHGQTFAQYLAISAINKSGLDLVARSPLHYYAAYLDPHRAPRDETPSMRLGTAIHTAIYEPARFQSDYMRRPDPKDFPGALVTGDDYKRQAQAFDLAVSGTKDALKTRIKDHIARELGIYEPRDPKTPAVVDHIKMLRSVRFFDELELEAIRSSKLLLSSDEMIACEMISKNLRRSAAARVILENGKPETTVIWTDQETGVLCKARLDWLKNDLTIIADAKSTTDASPREFARSVYRYGYHRQAAWYLDGVEAATGTRPALFVFKAFETSAPYASAYYHATDAMIEQGRKENRFHLKRYAEALKSGKWSGYPDEICPLDLPKWSSNNEVEKQLEVF